MDCETVPLVMKNCASLLFGEPVFAMASWYCPVKASC